MRSHYRDFATFARQEAQRSILDSAVATNILALFGIKLFSSTVTFTANAISGQGTFAHGLNYTPRYTLATVNPGAQGAVVACHATADASNINILGEYVNGFAATTTLAVTIMTIR